MKTIPVQKLNDLEKRAKHVIHELLVKRAEDDAPRSPVAIEFAGSPKSGKSSTIDTVVHFFKRMGFKVFAPIEGASKRTPEQLRHDRVAFNAWTINDAISQLLSSYFDPDKFDLIILDRGCFDSVAWTELHRKKGLLPEHEADILRDFALHPKWTRIISRLYLFTCDPEVSLRRETAATLTMLNGRTMNHSTLSDLRHEYVELTRTLSSAYPIVSIDTTTSKTPRVTGFTVADDILKIWEEAIGATERNSRRAS